MKLFYFLKKAILILVFFNCYSTIGQTLKGKILDDKEKPIPFVNIIEKGTINGVISDISGEFSIPLTKLPTKLEVSYVGFKKLTKQINSQEYVTIILKKEDVGLSEIIVIGSRNTKRTAVDTPVPLDIIEIEELASKGPQISINQILNYVSPSFNSQPQSISDGTDHIDPASLRGLGPDHILVLINGKRRHTSSLINVNGTFGAGSVGTDMNAIPTAAIERVEILRDGASAQYGSDAIAGIINIVLKDNTNKLDISVNTGANFSRNSNHFEGGSDGEKVQINANYGLPLGKKGGFVNFTGSISTREPALRSKDHSGNIFRGYHAAERLFAANGGVVGDMTLSDYQDQAANIDYLEDATKNTIAALDVTDLTEGGGRDMLRELLDFDADEEELEARGLTRKDFRMKVGTSKLREGKFFANMSIPLNESSEIYTFGGISYRQGLAAGFYRRPAQEDGRANTPAFPNGFLPHIGSDILDRSLAFGIRGELNDWNVDFSNTYGKNSFLFTVSRSSNGTQGVATQTTFDAGSINFMQNTTNLDFSKFSEDIFSGLNVAFGAEYKVENYTIVAGEEASYTSYDIEGKAVNANTSDDLLVRNNFTGVALGGGAQVFRGYDPKNETNKYRNSIAAYIDLEADITQNWLVGIATRMENFSDFGTTFNYKLASRLKLSENISLRGSHSTGFRAPSLHQRYFSRTSTLFINNVAFEQGTFTNDSRAAALIGIEKLKEEKSKSFSLGITSKIGAFAITADTYLIDIDDKIVYSGSFGAGDNVELKRIFKSVGATDARFFVNAIDTRSKGFEIVVSHSTNLSDFLNLKSDLSGTFSETEVTALKIPDKIIESGQSGSFFGAQEEAFLTLAQPKIKIGLTNYVSYKKWSLFLRNLYFGEVTDPDEYSAYSRVSDKIADDDSVYGGKIITDLTTSVDIKEGVSLTVGANNLFDVYPDKNRPARSSGDQFVYSRRTSQFGYIGRYLFVRINFKL